MNLILIVIFLGSNLVFLRDLYSNNYCTHKIDQHPCKPIKTLMDLQSNKSFFQLDIQNSGTACSYRVVDTDC